MGKHTENVGAAPAKTVEQIVNGREFGNLSKAVPLAIISAGIAVGLVVVAVTGGDSSGWINAGLIVASATGAGAIGSATTYLGDSQTQKDLKAVQAAGLEPVSGSGIGALPVNSGLLNSTSKVSPKEPEVEDGGRFDSVVSTSEVLEFEPVGGSGTSSSGSIPA